MRAKIAYAGLVNQITQSYTYDNLNRLESATELSNTNQQTWKQTFVYDRFGNRTFNTTNNATTTPNQTLAAKVTNPNINTSDNRLKKDQDNDNLTDYDYDVDGNLILDAENKRFVYDAENHQTKFFLQTNSTTTPDAVYEYDGEGKRVRKISGQNETIFVYNGAGQMVAEYATQISATPQVSYLTMDHLGSPRIITDGGGAVLARHDYTAFGADVAETIGAVGGRTAAQGYGSIEQVRQGYTGYENDEESKLDYAQARYYNSAHGRFTSVDPLTASANIKDPQTFNRYSYALNSPYKFTDPLGLLPLTSAGACGQFCRNSGGQVDGSAFHGSDVNGLINADVVPTFDWDQLSPDEQRIFNNSSRAVEIDGTRQTVGGQELFNYLAAGTPKQQRQLAGILNQTRQLETTTFRDADGNPVAAISLVTSISFFDRDRIFVNADPNLKEMVKNDPRFNDVPDVIYKKLLERDNGQFFKPNYNLP